MRLGARAVTRRFGPVIANQGVDLAVARGSIHAVVGENGAGKTVLMRILYGLDRPDEGTVIIDDEAVSLRGPADALRRGIGMVQQELAMIPELTLLENLVLGNEPVNGPLIDWDRARREAEMLARRVGIDVEWDATAAGSPIAVQQQIEILRLLSRGVDILILDEPTAVLAPVQVEQLFGLLRDLRDEDRTVIFISHKLDEVLSLADEVTVLRGGRTVTTVAVGELTRRELAELIVGGDFDSSGFEPSPAIGERVLMIDELTSSDDRGIERLRGVSISVHAGEIVGVAGVSGNGQDELVECVIGLRRPTGGGVRCDGRDLSRATVAARRSAGLAYVSADRKREGLAITAPLIDNVLAGFHHDKRVARAGWLILGRVRTFVKEVLGRFGVHYGQATDPASSLSGGNQQRVVLGRELSAAPRVLVAAQPTRGVDIQGIAFIHGQLRALRDQGSAVLVVSEELDELLALSDRIVVLYRGRVAGELPGGVTTRSEVGQLMVGEGAAA